MTITPTARKALRIAIANDVLDMIALNLIQARQSFSYVTSGAVAVNTTLCDVLPTLKPHAENCTVCGIGAAVLSAARMGNVQACAVPLDAVYSETPIALYEGSTGLLAALEEIFDLAQVAAIEVAFEGMSDVMLEDGGYYDTLQTYHPGLYQAALDFHDDRDGMPPIKLLQAIWENVRDNEGVFRP